MNQTAPHYLLFTEAKTTPNAEFGGGRWRFVLEEIGTTVRFEEADTEPGVRGERLQLLAVVRGLEALEQESRVTLITPSKHVGRGIRRGLTQWRRNDWQWERYGVLALIKNHDLWKRIDRAMQIHKINCRVWQFDPPHVRTQFAHESDHVEQGDADDSRLPRISHPAVRSRPALQHSIVSQTVDSAPMSSHDEFEASVGRGNHLTLNLEHSRRAVENTLEHVNRVSAFLSDKVKPIGKGRAFGYSTA